LRNGAHQTGAAYPSEQIPPDLLFSSGWKPYLAGGWHSAIPCQLQKLTSFQLSNFSFPSSYFLQIFGMNYLRLLSVPENALFC
jgi:hypothetical protein